MKLHDASTMSIVESKFQSIPICEDGEGPRWKFGYNGVEVTDFHPDILLLGAYKHPNTGNNLVGGINLNYVSPKQRDAIARALPQIMKQNNLKGRYWAGRQLVPDVFNNYYRTYNSRFIHGVQKDVLYPKYGYLKTAQNWLKKKLRGLLKSKEQRAKEAEPKYPNDLQSMQDRLDQAVLQLAQEPPADKHDQDTPEMRAALQNFRNLKKQRSMKDIERQEDEPFIVAQQDLDRAYREPGEQDAEKYEADMQIPIPKPKTPQEIGQEIEDEEEERQIELSDPNNEIDPNIDLEESIMYYSPIVGRYIIEHVQIM